MDNEEIIESTLRPKNWADYIGQERIKKQFKSNRLGLPKKEKKRLTIFSFTGQRV